MVIWVVENNFTNAIKKYGKLNFKQDIIEQFDSKLEASNAQEKYINEYNTLMPNGYNISPKGGHQFINSILEETKEKIRNKQKGIRKKQKMIDVYGEEKGLKKYEEFILKEKKAFAGRYVGLKRSEESKQKNREKHIGRKASIETIKKMELSQQKRREQPVAEETKEKIRGEKNPMYGKSVYDIWVKKYGKSLADQKWKKKYNKNKIK